MRSFSEHIEILEFENELRQLTEDSRQVQKAQKTLKDFGKTLGEKGWEVGEIKENDPDDYGQLLIMSARKEKYPEPSDFRDSSMVMISVDVRFRQTRGQRASSSISTSVYQKQKWQKVSMAKFWEYVRAVENEKEFKDRKIKELQTAHRKGRISDEDFADSMKLYESEETELNEVFEKPYPWKWQGFDADPKNKEFDSAYAATDKPTQIWISFLQAPIYDGPGEVEVDFSRKTKDDQWRADVVGEGDAFRIFATVIDVIKDFIKIYPKKVKAPLNKLSFTAHKPSTFLSKRAGNNPNSRANLYTRMVKRFASSVGATVSIEDTKDKTYFYLKFK